MERISVMKVITFSVENAKAEIATNESKQVSTITDEEVMAQVETWLEEIDWNNDSEEIWVDEEGNQL